MPLGAAACVPAAVITIWPEKPGSMFWTVQSNAVSDVAAGAPPEGHTTPVSAAKLKFQPVGALTVMDVIA